MKEVLEGAHTLATRVGGAPYPPRRAPCLAGHLEAPRCPSSGIRCLCPGKNQKEAFGTKRRRLEVELGRNQSRAPAELFCRGNFPLGGEIITIVITNDPLIGRGSISINIFTSTISSQTLVHLLYPIFVSKPQIGTCGLLVVLITSCS